jgi:type VII secretion integral membrane protein EccD
MNETATAEVCRLVVVGPTSQVDLSVPVHVPLTDLMPTLLRSLGTDLADRGLEHSGWVMQRLGEAPLDEDLTTDDLDLVDGDVLHLRPRSEQIPPLDFDDLVDGIATGIRNRSGLWRSETTRSVSLTALGFWLLAAWVVPLLPADDDVRSLTALGASLLLLIATAAAARIARDRAIGRLSAVAAVAFAAQAGTIWGAGAHLSDRPSVGAVLAGSGLAILVAMVAVLVAGPRTAIGPVAVGIVLTGGCALGGAFLRTSTNLDWAQIASLLLLLTIGLRPSIPLLGFKLAGMALPPLPIEPEDLQIDIEPEPAPFVLERTAVADLFMTMMYLSCGLVSGAALVGLALSPGRLPILAVVLGALAQLLALRPMTSAWHRLALGIPATLGLAVAPLALAARSQASTRAVVLGLLLLLAVAAATAAHTVPRRRLTPMWGRAGDWAQTVTLFALVPVILTIIGAFAAVRRQVG